MKIKKLLKILSFAVIVLILAVSCYDSLYDNTIYNIDEKKLTVTEVKFLLKKDPLILSIQPEKLYALELLIKQRISFTIRQGNWMPPFISEHHLPITIKDL
ncbi:MAG: hypothetical protein LBE11_01730 [Prevotellaceae bacterium]|jgi:hypothetical protein|nr:hypothetical protein [Prevotellaceae bacterium]